jgi:hypothetical protein
MGGWWRSASYQLGPELPGPLLKLPVQLPGRETLGRWFGLEVLAALTCGFVAEATTATCWPAFSGERRSCTARSSGHTSRNTGMSGR